MPFNIIKLMTLSLIITSSLHADWIDNMKDAYTQMKTDNNQSTTLSAEEQLKQNKKIQQEHFESIWNKIKDELIESSELYDKKDRVPNSAFWATDKKDINDDIDDILNDIIKTLINDDLLEYKKRVEKINKKIKKYEREVSEYREERVGAPEESLIHTTKEGYDKKIKETNDEITIAKNEIRIIQNNLKQSFKEIDVDLTLDQIDTLLVRADGYDIIQVSLVMNVLKQITNQILTLMKGSDEDLVQAKRYYGMHLMSLTLVVHIQQRYLDAVDNIYTVRLKKILKKNRAIINETQRAIQFETDSDRKSIYKNNLEAQNLILNVINLYKNQLIASRNQMKKAQDEAKKNILVAENTYRTVALSSSLYRLVSQDRLVFDKISKIQIPDIVPFKNTQMKKQYKMLQKEILDQ
jgi:hypothetical protein